ncbi:MAG: sulfoacetaldehyde acetyltransferase [Proteobacteria bacterium]|nr:sulfoacetaldehyde acetyltransferase [Pseudomonadota bacterium]MBU1387962.1 sulfoacetaldehyde acetyltransferase [Pseudomonadota bacterium]MBU1542025.1 sulfoacetaldehyde acetyltransferase [Pseudomonadota bacterium]MBU2431130.1 sulfoacetaldehyde acetyltransferase [Pseudomonadota bacterium]MBU2481111.1 sulfoacetaldehyde acetyltransferase [Pseudomonadota bacterium]
MARIKMTPSEALVETLVAEGVDTVFGIVGSAYMDALDLFPAAGIRFVPVAHEQAACHAADGLARVTGRPQACIAQNGPGAANFVSALTAAYWAHSPVVAIAPETGSMGIGTGGFQELDQMAMFEKQTVYQVRVNRPERMAEFARRCFYMAKLENGPTHLNIPRDYFYGVCEDEIYTTMKISVGSGSKSALHEAAKLLASAKYPVILSGGGVSQADALKEVVALANYLTAPVVNSYLHNDTFPCDHPLACGPIGYCGSKAAMRVIKKADVVLALGSRLGPFGTLPQYDMTYWPEKAKIIQVDANPKVLGLSRRVDVASQADAKEYAADLLSAIQALDPSRRPNAQRIADVENENKEWNTELDTWSSSENKLMHPRRFLKELAKAMPKGSIVATDIGNNSSMCNAYLKFNNIRQHISALSWGNCGFAYGAAMGAKIGCPDSPVFAFQGDGAYGISGIAEVMTAVRENIPVIAIVANNFEWGAEKKNQIDYYDNRFVGANLRENPDYAKIAVDMGAKGYTIEDYRQVGDVIKDAVASNQPCVINAIIQGGEEVLAEPFRRDALNMPVRYLDKYKHLNA